MIRRQIRKLLYVTVFLLGVFFLAKFVVTGNSAISKRIDAYIKSNISNRLVKLEPDDTFSAKVLGENTSVEQIISNDHVSFYVPVSFNEGGEFTKNLTVDSVTGKSIDLSGKLTASNVVYEVKAGSGISVDSSKQNPTVSNSGVLSVGGKTGAVTLTAGTGVTIDGTTITNKDLGSSVMTFKTYSVSGQTDISAGSNTDTLTLAGSGVTTITTDSTNKKITFTTAAPDYGLSGWTDGGTAVYMTTITDSVGIGTSSPTSKLHVSGSTNLAGNVAIGGTTSNSITFTGRMANGTSLLPDTDLGSDLGASGKRFNNLWVANINSNSQSSFAGQTTFTYEPTSTAYTESSVIINPTAPVANGYLFATGVAGYQRSGIDEDGDLSVGYSGLVSIPETDYPLNIYNHNTTRVAYFDSNGNLNISGSIISGSGSTISGDLKLTAGSSIIPTADAVNALSIGNAASTDFVSFDTLNSRVGIGTTTPTASLHLVSTAATTNAMTTTANSLSTGYGMSLTSTSTALSTGRLINLDWSPSSATTATGDLFRLNIGANGTIGNLLNITDNDSSLFLVSETQIVSALPHSFTAAGDVSVAYDIVLTNQNASNIFSWGPLTIESGESWESNNLTLRTYNSGDIVFDSPGGLVLNQAQAWDLFDSTVNSLSIESTLMSFDTLNSRVGIGSTTPLAALDVSGTAWLRGASAAQGLYVNSSGNVGIGTTNPGAKLDVRDATNNLGLWMIGSTTADKYSSLVFGEDAASNYGGIFRKSNASADGGGVTLFYSRSKPLALSTGSTFTSSSYNLYIDTGGNIGIGTTAPMSKIGVLGNLSVGATYGTVAAPTSGAIIEGNVGIGTTSPAYTTQIVGTLGVTGTDTATQKLYVSNSLSDSSTHYGILSDVIENADGTVMGIYGQGRIQNAGTGTVYGLYGNAYKGSGSTGTTGSLKGVYSLAFNNASSNITNISLFEGMLQNIAASSTATNFYGLKINDIAANLGTITSTYGVYVGDLTTGTQTNTPFSIYTSDASALNYFAGNVGIGTTSPASKLHVSGGTIRASEGSSGATAHSTFDNLVVENNSKAGISIMFPNADNGGIQFSAPSDQAVATINAYYNNNSQYVSFLVNNSEAVRIVKGGNVGIGTTAPGYKFQVQVDGSTQGHVAADGTWSNTSDIRLKKNITDYSLEDPLEKILDLRGIRYDFVSEETKESAPGGHIGFIAQEVEKIIPEIVGTDGRGIKSISYAGLTPVLVGAVQEQQKEISNIKNQISNMTTPTPVISISELKDLLLTGSLTVEGTAEFKGKTIFQAVVEFFEKIIFHKEVEFADKVIFDKDTAGMAVIPWGANEVEIVFEKPYSRAPIINISTVVKEATDSAFLADKQKAYLSNVTEKGFKIVLPDPAMVDATYNWIAMAVRDPKTTMGKSGLEEVLGIISGLQASSSAEINPTSATSSPSLLQSPSPTITTPVATPSATIFP